MLIGDIQLPKPSQATMRESLNLPPTPPPPPTPPQPPRPPPRDSRRNSLGLGFGSAANPNPALAGHYGFRAIGEPYPWLRSGLRITGLHSPAPPGTPNRKEAALQGVQHSRVLCVPFLYFAFFGSRLELVDFLVNCPLRNAHFDRSAVTRTFVIAFLQFLAAGLARNFS